MMAAAKLTIDVESLLSVTFRDELPKRQREGGKYVPTGQMHPMWRAGVFGGRVDNWTREPGFPTAMGDCDPDALVVEAAVNDLKGYGLHSVPADAILAGLPLQESDAAPALDRASRAARVLVAMHAKLRTRPGVGVCEIEPKRLANGVIGIWKMGGNWHKTVVGDEIWVEMEEPCKAVRGKIYPAGAYCALNWSPSPKHVLLERCEYLAWRAALAHLAMVLNGQLRRWIVTDTLAPAAPWLSCGRAPAIMQAVA